MYRTAAGGACPAPTGPLIMVEATIKVVRSGVRPLAYATCSLRRERSGYGDGGEQQEDGGEGRGGVGLL